MPSGPILLNYRLRVQLSSACHLDWRQEPQASSPILTPTARSLQCWDRRVMPRLVWGMEFWLPLELFRESQAPCRAVCGTCGCFQKMHGGVSAPSFCAFPHRVSFKEVSGHRVHFKSGPGNRGHRDPGGYQNPLLPLEPRPDSPSESSVDIHVAF